MRVLILDNYDSFTYNIYHYCKSVTSDVQVYRNDDIELADIDQYSHIILSPGPGLPKDAGILMKVIESYVGKKPILGVCLGLQALAEYFGGKLFNQNQVKHGIQEEINLLQTSSGIFEGLESKAKVGLYHSWAVEAHSLPEEVQITALSKKGIVMGIEHQKLQFTGVQFHPESVMTPKGKIMMENWLRCNHHGDLK